MIWDGGVLEKMLLLCFDVIISYTKINIKKINHYKSLLFLYVI